MVAYGLYVNRKNMELTIKPWKHFTTKYGEIAPEIYKFNPHYVLSKNRAALRQYGRDLKQQWIIELLEQVKYLENTDVKTQY